jgi:hypothetical protein
MSKLLVCEQDSLVWGAPITAILEAMRLARRLFGNPTMTTYDLLNTMIGNHGLETPVVRGKPLASPMAFAYRFARNRLLDAVRHRKVVDAHASAPQLSATSGRPDLTSEEEEKVAFKAIDWFMTTLKQIESGELPAEITVKTGGGVVRLRLPNPKAVAATLRGIYLEGRTGSQMAVALSCSEPQVTRYRQAGLRYIQVLAAEELS